ncbi:probable E3 ubiquitin-protein ligase RNF217 [Sinocyclocheilus grahami]|uniref:probable E3 ubiquitin-protein ligase RNF217 n=1 Tax=Sinocyclocheilus grahami TaxID=75366 RepID=UPI0007ACAE5A|nr:PREDICTED: probable E3 ubiquitin-protein ligase RNF217 [Sinocyclocheilus grahami]
MEDESSMRMNVTAQNMPGYIGRDGESVHVSSGTRSTDFGRDVRSSDAKVPSSLSLSSKDVLECLCKLAPRVRSYLLSPLQSRITVLQGLFKKVTLLVDLEVPQVHVGRAHLVCPITECSGFLEDSLVISNLSSEELTKYKYFLELSRLDSSTKPCPQCSLFTSLKDHSQQTSTKSEHKYKIQCTKCQFVWCFKCHAPWHEGLKCRDYRKGDKLLRHWASVIEHGQRNAQKCPHCKPELFSVARFTVSKVLVAPVVIVLVVVVGALALVIGLFALPIYYICKRRRKRSQGSGRWLC